MLRKTIRTQITNQNNFPLFTLRTLDKHHTLSDVKLFGCLKTVMNVSSLTSASFRQYGRLFVRKQISWQVNIDSHYITS